MLLPEGGLNEKKKLEQNGGEVGEIDDGDMIEGCGHMVVGRNSYGGGEWLIWWWGGAHMVVGRGSYGGGEVLIGWWEGAHMVVGRVHIWWWGGCTYCGGEGLIWWWEVLIWWWAGAHMVVGRGSYGGREGLIW